MTGALSDGREAGRYSENQAAEFVTAVYRSILRRDPDARGLADWTGKLSSGRANLEGLLVHVVKCNEFAVGLRDFVRHYVNPGQIPLCNDMSQYGEVWLLIQSIVNEAAVHRIVVDAGARGRERSNSYDLLRHFGWRGVLIEANPRLARSIREEFGGLDIDLVSCAVSDRNGTAKFFIGRNDDVSSLNASKTEAWGAVREEVSVEMRRLSDILYERNIPLDFDVLSLDLEGEDARVLNEALAAGFRPGWVFLEMGRASEIEPLASPSLSDLVRQVYRCVTRTKSNLLLRRLPGQ